MNRKDYVRERGRKPILQERRSHLTQSWYRKIQEIGLSSVYIQI